MIGDFFLDLCLTVASWFLGMFPTDYEVPPWFADAAAASSDVFDNAVGLGAWIGAPIALLTTAVTAVAGLWVVGLLIKFARWLVGLIPTMGGG